MDTHSIGFFKKKKEKKSENLFIQSYKMYANNGVYTTQFGKRRIIRFLSKITQVYEAKNIARSKQNTLNSFKNILTCQ